MLYYRVLTILYQWSLIFIFHACIFIRTCYDHRLCMVGYCLYWVQQDTMAWITSQGSTATHSNVHHDGADVTNTVNQSFHPSSLTGINGCCNIKSYLWTLQWLAWRSLIEIHVYNVGLKVFLIYFIWTWIGFDFQWWDLQDVYLV